MVLMQRHKTYRNLNLINKKVMSRNKKQPNALLAHLMQELYAHAGANYRGILRSAHMGQSTLQTCLRGETRVSTTTIA